MNSICTPTIEKQKLKSLLQNKKIYFALLFLSLIGQTFAQDSLPTSVNKFDSKGKKDGIWIQRVDSSLHKVATEKAVFYYYVWFHNGIEAKVFSGGWYKRWKLTYDKNAKVSMQLNGLYTWTKKNDKIKVEMLFENGFPVFLKSYSKGEVYETVDYKKLYNDIPGTYYYHYGKTKLYFRNGEKGWTGYTE